MDRRIDWAEFSKVLAQAPLAFSPFRVSAEMSVEAEVKGEALYLMGLSAEHKLAWHRVGLHMEQRVPFFG